MRALPPWAWALACGGGVLVLLSFTLDSRAALAAGRPPDFRWGLFGSGIGVAAIALIAAVRRGLET